MELKQFNPNAIAQASSGTPAPAATPVATPATPEAPASEPAAPTPQTPEASAPAKPRQRVRRSNGQFQPAPKAAAEKAPEKAEPSPYERAQAEKAAGIEKLEAYINSKEAIAKSKNDSVQQVVDGGEVAEELPPVAATAEGTQPEEPAVVDETLKARALSAGFKAEELAGLSNDQIQTQVVLHDRWIATQGLALVSGEKKPVEQPAVTPVATPKVEAPKVETQTDFDAELGEEVDDTIRAKFKALHQHHATKVAALEGKFARVAQILEQQENQRTETEVKGYLAANPHKDSFSTKPFNALSDSDPKEKLTKAVLTTAAGMEVYFAQQGKSVSRKELIDRAVLAVVGVQPVKPKAATASARPTSRSAPFPMPTRETAVSAIGAFMESRGGLS